MGVAEGIEAELELEVDEPDKSMEAAAEVVDAMAVAVGGRFQMCKKINAHVCL